MSTDRVCRTLWRSSCLLAAALLLLACPAARATTVTLSYDVPRVFEWTPPTDQTLEGSVKVTITSTGPIDLLEPDADVMRLNSVTFRFYHRWYVPSPRLIRFRDTFGDTIDVYSEPQPVHPLGSLVHGVPIVALALDPGGLWDAETGIYCWGNHVNFEQTGDAWERAAAWEWRAADGTLLFAEPVGLRIHGSTSRQFAQKGLRLYFDGYDATPVQRFDAFGDGVDDFSRLLLRSARYPDLLLRSNTCETLFRELGHLGSRYRPVAVYLNDEYWGLYNLRDRYDAEFGLVTLGHADGDFVLLKDSETEHGDGQLWWNFLWSLSRPADYADPAWFAAVASQLDLTSYVDWLIINIFAATADNGYTNNLAQLRVGAGPWQWLMWDEDDTFLDDNLHADLFRFYSSGNATEFNAARPPVWYMGYWTETSQLWFNAFRHLMQNAQFRTLFSARWDQLLDGPLSPAALQSRIDVLAQAQAPELDAHAARWGWVPNWYADTVTQLKKFIDDRTPLVQAQKAAFLADWAEPVRLTAFTATVVGDTVQLDWSTATESGLAGWVVQRAVGDAAGLADYASYATASALVAAGGTGVPAAYAWTDGGAPVDQPLHYRLVQMSTTGVRTIEIWTESLIPVVPVPLVINEFMADNDHVAADEAGEYEDWIELYNAGAETVDLTGYTLTDDLGAPAKWTFQPVSIGPGGHLLVWCDDEGGQGPLHAAFKLGAGGESVGLYRPAAIGGQVVDALTYGPQTTDRSYGRLVDGGAVWDFIAAPTPGFANDPGVGVPSRGVARLFCEPVRPNPATGSARLRFELPPGSGGVVRLEVFDLRGRRVRNLLPGDELNDGAHVVDWDCCDDDGRRAPAGTYVLRLTAGGRSVSRKVVLAR